MSADGVVRVYTLLHDARPVLLNFDERLVCDVTSWTDRVRLLDVTYSGAWEIPEIGVIAAPTAVLIRPDGYVAWVGLGTDAGLTGALTTWLGKP